MSGGGCFAQTKHVVSSPNSKVQIVLTNENGIIYYQVFGQEQELILPSKLSLFPDKKGTIKRIGFSNVDRVWEPVWGQFSKIRDHFEEQVFSVIIEGNSCELICRAYDNGVAFRFVINQNPELKDIVFNCEFNLGANSTLYYPAGENEPIGPIKPESTQNNIKLPVVVMNANKSNISILESDLFSAQGFEVMNISYDQERDVLVSKNSMEYKSGQIVTPWRVILIEDKVGDFLVNTVSINLAAPNKLDDTSWIKPGKAMWDWRVSGYIAPDGFKYAPDTKSFMRFIDFAAAHNIEYFLIDASWYTKIEKDHIETSENVDILAVSQHARDQDVGLILYYDRKRGNFGDEHLFEYYNNLGMIGIKYGFMGENVVFTRNAIQESAKNKLLINFHDNPVPFTGVRRTFPNAVSREYNHAQLDDRRTFTPRSFIKMAMINAIQGPLDMTNGYFDILGINSGDRTKGPYKLNSYFTTVTAEAARVLIAFTGIACLPDAPEVYSSKIDLFEFIQKLPIGRWDETRILHAKMGEYISTARRHGDEWFIGSVVSEKGGELPIVLDFLTEDLTYDITFFEDDTDTHYKDNPEIYRIRKGVVKKGDVIKAEMAPGGGHAMWIRPL